MRKLLLFLCCLMFAAREAAADTTNQSAAAGERPVLYAPPPAYPREAFEARLEGTVKVAFDVSPEGVPTNVHAIESSSPGVFDQAAVETVGKWLYQPLTPGSPGSTTSMSTVVAFKLGDARISPKPVTGTVPRYPPQAAALGAMGACTIDFTVNADGRVSDAKVNRCFPAGLFDEASLKAIATWTFEPALGPSGPIPASGRMTFNYRMRGAPEKPISYLKAGQWITLKYTLNERGRAKDVEVIDKSDPDIWEKEAIQQVKNTQFSPVIENGMPVEKPNQRIRTVGN